MNRKIVIFLTVLVIVVIAAAYFLINRTASMTIVYVDPGTIEKGVGQDFIVNVSASNVDNLYGWEFKLGWNAAILDLLGVTEGMFLKSGGSTFFTYRLNETVGYVLVDCSLLGNVGGVNGTGALASIQLHVRSGGSCDLNLYDTKLVDPSAQTIDHTANSGHFSASS
jgi:hypothetical protein